MHIVITVHAYVCVRAGMGACVSACLYGLCEYGLVDRLTGLFVY